MEYRTFGKLGWKVSTIGFGAWAIGGNMWGPQDDNVSKEALNRALDLGINFIDTAQGYGHGHSEELIGEVLSQRTEEVLVATKVPPIKHPWPPPDGADGREFYPSSYIIDECEKSLKRLQRDYVDIYQCHTWATSFNLSHEIAEAMLRLLEAGKIRAFGVSVPDMTPDNVIGALAMDRVHSVQVIYNLFDQYPQQNLFPVAERLGTGIIVRVPFDEGALTGKFTSETTFPESDVRRHYFRGRNLEAVVERVREIEEFKNRRHPDMSMAEYALRFTLSHPAVHTVIPGMRNVRQVEMNAVAGDGRLLDEDELQELKHFSWRKDFWNEEVETHQYAEHETV